MELLTNAIIQDDLPKFEVILNQDKILAMYHISWFQMCKPIHLAAEYGRI